VLAFGVLPALALVLAVAAGFLKWQDSSVRDGDIADIASVQAAKDSTIAMLWYGPTPSSSNSARPATCSPATSVTPTPR
jgi:hypothetical protein